MPQTRPVSSTRLAALCPTPGATLDVFGSIPDDVALVLRDFELNRFDKELA
ncbi:hypothetical protein ACFMPD_03650 [Sedimentitalea sp. HM32M-2]|uniref:hypothetical protein n=1 Tax=Sedimentitalea sp. HM32M-2 TaxID=3351566 RepID=UPI003644E4A7